MIYILVAEGFEETELVVPTDILRRGGADVKLVGVTDECVSSTRGVTIKTDITLADVSVSGGEMLVIPGGQPGVDNLWADERVKELVKQFAEADKFIGAICAAPMILGRLGLLDGKKATCYPGCETDLFGAETDKGPVVCDGKFITSKGPGTAFAFGFELLKAVKGAETAEDVARGMQYNIG